LHNILLEFGVPKKLVRPIKMCLIETYGKVRIGKDLCDKFSYPEWPKTTRCIIVPAFQLFFRICHYEDSGKPGGT
jgi:hypothetical protein